MGGGGEFHGFSYPKYVWSPTGGWWVNRINWKRNTALGLIGVAVGVGTICMNWAPTHTATFEAQAARLQTDRARAYMRWVRRQPAERQAEIQAAMEHNEAERARFAAGDYLAVELAGPPAEKVFADLGFKKINFIEEFHTPFTSHRGRW